MEIIEFDKNRIERFAHSNKLIEARYSLNLEEQRLVLTMISMIKPTDDDFKCYRIKIKEFADFFKIKGDSIVAHVKKTAKSLVGKPITIKDASKTLYLSWISSAEFPENEESGEKNYVELSFDPKLKPYLLKMKEQYTLLENFDLIKLKSGYSVRIYMLLKQYLKIAKRTFKIADLREMLGIDKKQYSRSYDFKVNVLNKATSDINGKTELMVTMLEGKKIGKTLMEVIFTIREKTEKEKMEMAGKNEKNGGRKNEDYGNNNEQIGDSKNEESGENEESGDETNLSIISTKNQLQKFQAKKESELFFDTFWEKYEPTSDWNGKSGMRGSKTKAKTLFLDLVSKGESPVHIIWGAIAYLKKIKDSRQNAQAEVFLRNKLWEEFIEAEIKIREKEVELSEHRQQQDEILKELQTHPFWIKAKEQILNSNIPERWSENINNFSYYGIDEKENHLLKAPSEFIRNWFEKEYGEILKNIFGKFILLRGL